MEPSKKSFLGAATIEEIDTTAPSPSGRRVRYDSFIVSSDEVDTRKSMIMQRLGLISEKQLNRRVTPEEYTEATDFLTEKGKHLVGAHYLEDIYELVQRNKRSRPIWRELIQAMANQRMQLASRLHLLAKNAENAKRQEDACIRELQEITATPSPTAEDETERLVIQAINIEVGGSRDDTLLSNFDDNRLIFLMRFSLGDQVADSDVMVGTSGEIFCNELFHFSLEDPSGKLVLEIIDAHNFGVDQDQQHNAPLAYGETDLAALKSMERIPINISAQGNNLTAVVHTTMQWTKSRRDFYEQALQRVEDKRRDADLAVEAAESDLSQIDKTLFGKTVGSIAYRTPTAAAIAKAAVTDPSGFIDWSVDRIMRYRRSDDFPKVFQSVGMAVLCSSCAASFTRVLYIDALSVLYTLWCNLDGDRRWTKKTNLYCVLGLVLSFVQDLVWLYYNLLRWRDPDSGIAFATRILTFVNMGLKNILLLFLLRSRKNIKQ